MFGTKIVMGGASESEFENGTGIWKGIVTSANNGGFVGIRTTPSFLLDMKACNGIILKVKGGNNKGFKAIVRDSTDFNGICWTTSFDAPRSSGGLFSDSNGASIKIPFSKQVPTIFARRVPDQVFNPGNVVGLQLTYSKVG